MECSSLVQVSPNLTSSYIVSIPGALDTLKTVTPLVNKVILTWVTDSYIYYRATPEERVALDLNSAPQGLGYGIGLAFALFIMQGTSATWIIVRVA